MRLRQQHGHLADAAADLFHEFLPVALRVRNGLSQRRREQRQRLICEDHGSPSSFVLPHPMHAQHKTEQKREAANKLSLSSKG